MSNEISKFSPGLTSDLQRINECDSVERLVDELQSCLLGGIELWIKAAAIWERIKTISPDVDIRLDIGRYLSRMNIPGRPGPLLPELFSAMMSRPRLLDTAMRYPFEDQQLLAERKPIKVFIEGGDHRAITWESMTKRERDQVFGKDHLRREAEQLSWLRDQRAKAELRNATIDQCPVVVDKKHKCIIVHGYSMSVKELLRYASDLG